jgi:hypothetical protein
MNKAYDYQKESDFEGNTGALGGQMNDSNTDRRSEAKKVMLMASKVHENEFADYTSEDVDQTLFANNPPLNVNAQKLQMERPNTNNIKKKVHTSNQLVRNGGEQDYQI